jgi:ketosteroid isomerase-like protein
MDSLHTAMERWQQAILRRDAAAASEVLHPDYALVLVAPAPASMPRARWLEVLNDYVVHDYAVEEQQADVSGGVAAVLSRVRMRATVLGEDRSGQFILSDIWLRDATGQWQVWRRHSSPLSAGVMPGSD